MREQPIKALLICGGCCHDYAKQKDILTQGISARANVEWVIAYDPVSTTSHLNPIYKNKDWYKGFDVIVHDECTSDMKNLDIINNTILAPHKNGLPAVVLHCGEHCYRSKEWPGVTPWFEFTGLQSTAHWKQLPIEVTFLDKSDPITQGMADWTTINEELYNNIVGKPLDTAHPLARGNQDHPGGKDGIDTDTVCVWTNLYNGKTKVFATTLGHNDETVADPRYLDLVTRGLLWSVNKLDAKHLKPAKKVMLFEPPPPPPSQATSNAASASLAADKEKPANPKHGDSLANPSKLLATMKGPKGFDVTIFAAPPDVDYVTCVSASPAGELFIGIDEAGSVSNRPNSGRVIRAIDSTGTGHADKFVTFAKMDHPRGVIWDDGKLYVLHPPFLGVYEENGFGVAGPEKILVRGISNEALVYGRGGDHTTNGIRMGIDGWIYIACGDYGSPKAIGSDGKSLQMHGGSIMRVRPDGTDLEVYSWGHRNIYDVSVDPLMNVFTRDNTNDGDNWNDRLAYIVPTGYYGYPSYFMHFPGEFINCLADYGDGAPCGSIWIDEPGWKAGLYTVEWGRQEVDRHPMTPDGANFKAGFEKFMDFPRGTDIDLDGMGHAYLSSWLNGGFVYTDPNVGFVARLTPQGFTAKPFPGLHAADDEHLLKYLTEPSAVLRQAAQHEILKRGAKPVFTEVLPDMAQFSGITMPGRSAAIFTLKLLLKSDADSTLAELTKTPDIRELSLRALADQTGDTKAPLAPFLAGLSDPNPRVRLIAAWGIARLGRTEAIDALLPRVADSDPLVAHVAINSLVTLHAVDACLASIKDSYPAQSLGCIRMLQHLHEPAVVDGLIAKTKELRDHQVRGMVYAGLCRLFHNEAAWDGNWWGTRPDTTGPYYSPVDWQASARIADTLAAALSTQDTEGMRNLIGELQRNGVETPQITQRINTAAAGDPKIRAIVIESWTHARGLSNDQIAMLRTAAISSDEPVETKVFAIRALQRMASGNPAALQAAADALGPVILQLRQDGPMHDQLNQFIHDTSLANRLTELFALAQNGNSGKRELSYAVLLNLARSGLVDMKLRHTAQQTIDQAWDKIPTAVALLRAIGLTADRDYAAKVIALKSDPRPAVAQTADEVAPLIASNEAGSLIEQMKYETVVAAAQKDKGDPKLGSELFTRQGCISCHTTSPAQPPKGPFLGGIATRYSRAELCESILRPSAKIAQGFETQWFKVKGTDQPVEGFVVRESGDDLELHNAAGISTTIHKSDIQQRGKRDYSVMPEGLVAKLTPHDLASILAYFESLPGK